MNLQTLLVLLVSFICVFSAAEAKKTDISAKNIIKSILAKLPEGGDYYFDNLETTVVREDGSTRTVFLSGDPEELEKATYEDEDM